MIPSAHKVEMYIIIFIRIFGIPYNTTRHITPLQATTPFFNRNRKTA
jgi:hypothetical protein